MDPNQIILINKPLRWTSFDVVKKIRNVLSRKPDSKETSPTLNSKLRTQNFKVGHAGTLDPLATGLLVICTGSFTKKIADIQNAEKEYTGSFILGSTTPSYDLETEVSESGSYSHVTRELIMETVKKFTGKQSQTPPAHSAVKVGGIRAYTKARKGQTVEIAAKEIDIKEFEIIAIDLPRIDIRVVCSKGTYIRSLVHDFGSVLGCGAYLSALCRTRIGEYSLKNAYSIEDFMVKYSSETNFSTEIKA